MVASTLLDVTTYIPCSPFGICVWKVTHLLEMTGGKSAHFLFAFTVSPMVYYVHFCLSSFLIFVSYHLSPVLLPSCNYVKVLLGLYVCGKKRKV